MTNHEQKAAVMDKYNLSILAMAYINPVNKSDEYDRQDMLGLLYRVEDSVLIIISQCIYDPDTPELTKIAHQEGVYRWDNDRGDVIDAIWDLEKRLRGIADEQGGSFEFYRFDTNIEALNTIAMYRPGLKLQFVPESFINP